jgi:hypothetical protein
MMSPRRCSRFSSTTADEKNARKAILNHAALIVRDEQRSNWSGRVRDGFMKLLVDTYHDQKQVWVTKHKIQFAVKKMKALESIPTETFHPVATVDVRMGTCETSLKLPPRRKFVKSPSARRRPLGLGLVVAKPVH